MYLFLLYIWFGMTLYFPAMALWFKFDYDPKNPPTGLEYASGCILFTLFWVIAVPMIGYKLYKRLK